jgi:hypothetical protein
MDEACSSISHRVGTPLGVRWIPFPGRRDRGGRALCVDDSFGSLLCSPVGRSGNEATHFACWEQDYPVWCWLDTWPRPRRPSASEPTRYPFPLSSRSAQTSSAGSSMHRVRSRSPNASGTWRSFTPTTRPAPAPAARCRTPFWWPAGRLRDLPEPRAAPRGTPPSSVQASSTPRPPRPEDSSSWRRSGSAPC